MLVVEKSAPSEWCKEETKNPSTACHSKTTTHQHRMFYSSHPPQDCMLLCAQLKLPYHMSCFFYSHIGFFPCATQHLATLSFLTILSGFTQLFKCRQTLKLFSIFSFHDAIVKSSLPPSLCICPAIYQFISINCQSRSSSLNEVHKEDLDKLSHIESIEKVYKFT